MAEIDTFNKQAVGVMGSYVTVLRPFKQMTSAEALIHAAYLITMAEATLVNPGFTFEEALAAVQNG